MPPQHIAKAVTDPVSNWGGIDGVGKCVVGKRGGKLESNRTFDLEKLCMPKLRVGCCFPLLVGVDCN